MTSPQYATPRNGNAEAGRKPPPWKRPLLLAFGWVFVLLGIAGLFLPILQGVLFLLVGIYLLSLGSARIRLWRQRMRRRLRARYPETVGKVEVAERKAMSWIRTRFATLRARFGGREQE